MKKIVSLILVFTIVFATNSMVASAQTNTVCQNGVGYKTKTYQVAGKYDTVTGIARVNSFLSSGTWTISSANNGKYADFSYGYGSSSNRFTNLRKRKDIYKATKEEKNLTYGSFLQAVNIKFYW